MRKKVFLLLALLALSSCKDLFSIYTGSLTVVNQTPYDASVSGVAESDCSVPYSSTKNFNYATNDSITVTAGPVMKKVVHPVGVVIIILPVVE